MLELLKSTDVNIPTRVCSRLVSFLLSPKRPTRLFPRGLAATLGLATTPNHRCHLFPSPRAAACQAPPSLSTTHSLTVDAKRSMMPTRNATQTPLTSRQTRPHSTTHRTPSALFASARTHAFAPSFRCFFRPPRTDTDGRDGAAPGGPGEPRDVCRDPARERGQSAL